MKGSEVLLPTPGGQSHDDAVGIARQGRGGIPGDGRLSEGGHRLRAWIDEVEHALFEKGLRLGLDGKVGYVSTNEEADRVSNRLMGRRRCHKRQQTCFRAQPSVAASCPS